MGFTVEDDANPVPFRRSSETRNVIGAVRGYLKETSPATLPMAGNIYTFNMSDIHHREYSVNVDIGKKSTTMLFPHLSLRSFNFM